MAKRTVSAIPTAPTVPGGANATDKSIACFSINTKLIKFLLQRGLTTDELFLEELPENQVIECRNLQKRLRDESLEHSQELLEHTKHVQVVAQLLLEFLKDLPEPLLTYGNYDSFIMSMYIKEKSHRTKYCATLLNTTPPHHVALATQLLTLLHRLVANRSVNGLTSELLAPLFAPHFLRPKKICPYMKEDEKAILSVMTALIDDYDLLFSGENINSLSSSGSTKLRKASDSPHVTDLSQSQLGSSKLSASSNKLLGSHVPQIESIKSHKRSSSSVTGNSFAAAMDSPRDAKDREDELTADDFSDEEVSPGLLSNSTDVASAPNTPHGTPNISRTIVL